MNIIESNKDKKLPAQLIIFPEELYNFSLTDFEQKLLGYFYLKSYESKNISLSEYDLNSYNIVNGLKSLLNKNLIMEVQTKTSNIYNIGALCITDFGIEISNIISKNPTVPFDIKNLSFSDSFDLYFKFFNGSYFLSICEPLITRYAYKLLSQDRIQVYNGNILRSADKHLISSNDKITETGGRHSVTQCICDYVTIKIPRKSKSSSDKQFLTCSISLEKLFEILSPEYFEIKEIESNDAEYLKLKDDYLEKKKYYEENKNKLEMMKSLTNSNISLIKKPTFQYKIFKYLIPVNEGKSLGSLLKDYSGFNILYKPH